MHELREHDIEQIPESRAARWVWRTSLIPLVGAALFIPLGFIALFQIGRGRTGLWLLRKGFLRNLWMSALGLLAVATYWFCPRWESDTTVIYNQGFLDEYKEKQLNPFSLDIAGTTVYAQGYVMRCWSWPEKFVKVGTWTYYYNNNPTKKAIEGNFWNDIKIDRWTLWYESGNKYGEKNYVNGALNGKCFVWYENGVKMQEIDLVSNKNAGLTKIWFDDGQLQGEIHHAPDGKYHGMYYTYYKNGLRQNELVLVDGKTQGKRLYFHKNGVKRSESETNNGKFIGKSIGWYNNGQKKEEGYPSENGSNQGEWSIWSPDGQERYSVIYRNSLPFSGHYKTWDEKRNPIEEGLYRNGKKIGRWKKWSTDLGDWETLWSDGKEYKKVIKRFSNKQF